MLRICGAGVGAGSGARFARSWSPQDVLLGARAEAGAEMLSRSWSRQKISRLHIPGFDIGFKMIWAETFSML